jgi:signal transduction histidine kinase
MSWPEIAQSEAVHEYLAELIRDQPRIKSLWLIDPAGIVRNSSAVFPLPPISVADRDYFIALLERDTGIYIGRVVRGRVLVEDIFNVAQRRVSASGKFDGVVVVSASPTYFTDFWKTIAHQSGSSILIRKDGAVLAREPAADANMLPFVSPLMQSIEKRDSGFYRASSTIDGQERLYAYRRIAKYPLYIGHGIDLSNALRTWHEHLAIYGGAFAIGALGLASLAFIAARRLHYWRATAQCLREEAERRAVAEEQLLHAQKMEVLGQTTGGIAHDLGNILHIVSGSLELLTRRAAPRDMLLLTRAVEAVERGGNAVKSMLSFARKQTLHSEVFDMRVVLAGMESLLRQALQSNIKLDIVPPAAPCWALADRNQLELAILNLAVNARDAMPGGGAVVLTATLVRLDGKPDGLVGDFVAVSVRDTGTGMLPDVRARAFDPFFTTKEPGKGTGLGLSMVYGFSKQSGGSVTIESDVGHGTSVVLYLPLSNAG